MKKLLYSTALSWILVVFFIPLHAASAEGDIKSSSKIPDLQLQIPIEKIINTGNTNLESTGSASKPGARLPVEKLSGITGAQLESGSGLGTYIQAIYTWTVTAITLLAVVFIMIGGLIWLTAAGSSKKIGEAKKIIMDSLMGLGIAVGSYLLLSTLSKDLVEFRLIIPGGVSKIAYEFGEPGESTSGGTSGGSQSGTNTSSGGEQSAGSHSGTVSGNGTWNASGTVWVPSAFKAGDKADVLYYFHGIIGTGGNCSGKNDTRATMADGGTAFNSIKNLIAGGSIEPIVLVVPAGDPSGKNNTLTGARSEAKAFLDPKKITIASESIAGHSNGGVVIKKEWNGNFKYIGLIDPWAIGITDTMINQKKDSIIYSYNRNNWSAKYADQRKRLQEMGNLMGQPEGSTAHCPFVAEHMKRITKYFKPGSGGKIASLPDDDDGNTEGSGAGGKSAGACNTPVAYMPQDFMALSKKLYSLFGISSVEAEGAYTTCSIPMKPLFNQKKYAIPYGIAGTIASSGCGPTSAAMVISHYNKKSGKGYTYPPDVAKIFNNAGYRGCDEGCKNHEVCCRGTRPAAFTDPKSIGKLGFKGKKITASRSTIEKYLKKETPIIVSVGPDIFTKQGHYIVLTGIDPLNEENYLINDPYTEDGEFGQRCYDVDEKKYCGTIPKKYMFSGRAPVNAAYYIYP